MNQIKIKKCDMPFKTCKICNTELVNSHTNFRPSSYKCRPCTSITENNKMKSKGYFKNKYTEQRIDRLSYQNAYYKRTTIDKVTDQIVEEFNN
jgi:hypothetical protein